MHSTNTLPLSVLIMTKNEEKNLPDCIKSVSFADDVIILDDDSTDSTRELAQSMGARVVQRKMDYEGRHRNYGYNLAKDKWVLSLDADERITPELEEEIRTLFKNEKFNSYAGYNIPRRNYLGTKWLKHGGQYPSAQVRLFQKGRFEYEEFEEVHPKPKRGGPYRSLQHDIIHYSYKDIYDWFARLNRHTTLESKKWYRERRPIGLAQTLRKTFDRFFKAYILKKGYKDGFEGFIMAVGSGLYQLLSYAKYRELLQNENKTHPC